MVVFLTITQAILRLSGLNRLGSIACPVGTAALIFLTIFLKDDGAILERDFINRIHNCRNTGLLMRSEKSYVASIAMPYGVNSTSSLSHTRVPCARDPHSSGVTRILRLSGSVVILVFANRIANVW